MIGKIVIISILSLFLRISAKGIIKLNRNCYPFLIVRTFLLSKIASTKTIDMQRFAMDHMMQDHLIVGFASEKANPFREKTWSCEVL